MALRFLLENSKDSQPKQHFKFIRKDIEMSHQITVTFREFDNMRENGHFLQKGESILSRSHAGRKIISTGDPVNGKFPVWFTEETKEIWIEEEALMSVTLGEWPPISDD
jgi:hypothetical protein